MQAPTTLTRDKGFNRLRAGAIGLALLAAATVGALALNDQADLPLIGSDSQAQPAIAAEPLVQQIRFVEQNSFDYVTPTTIQKFRLPGDWDARAGLAGEDSAPAAAPDYRFMEENAWDYGARAQVAGVVSAAAAAPDFRFIEENLWDTAGPLLPPADNGASDY